MAVERLRIENLYKIFSPSPGKAMDMLAAGETKDTVLARTGAIIGLNNVSLTVPAGGITMIMGLSGSGKSTLARCINRLHEPTAGRILLDGEDIVPLDPAALREVRRTRMSMVFQNFGLLPHRTVIENVEFGLKLRGVPRRDRRIKAEEVLDTVDLSRWIDHRPDQLSGGMRQRVGLARALATEADTLIMDEAFSALDPMIRSEMQDELLRLQRVLHKTILFITHDFQEALKLGTNVVIMANGEIVGQGSPQSIVLDPANDFVAAFTRDVDRARLFDARSAMSALSAVASDIWSDTPEGHGFVINEYERLVGVVHRADMPKVRAGVPVRKLMCLDHVVFTGATKLIDVASEYRPGRPMAVIDEDGRLIGALHAENILAGIAACPASLRGSKANG
jgi:glycine betaine/proline transport system ATP-binding protein